MITKNFSTPKSSYLKKIFLIILVFIISSSNFHIARASDFNSFYFENQPNQPTFSYSTFPGKFKNEYTINVVLPGCIEVWDSDCIESISYLDNKGVEQQGKISRYFPLTPRGEYNHWYLVESDERLVFKGDPQKSIPDGSKSSLWVFPGLSHSGGDEFLVTVNWVSGMSNQDSPLGADSKVQLNDGGFGAKIEAVKFFENPSNADYYIGGALCYAQPRTSKPFCMERAEMSYPTRFKMVIRQNLTKGWLNFRNFLVTRTKDFKASSELKGDFARITLEGDTGFLPRVEAQIPRNDEGIRILLNSYNLGYKDSGATNQPFDLNDLTPYAWMKESGQFISASDPNSIGIWQGLEGKVPIKVTDTDQIWGFSAANVPSTSVYKYWECSKKGTLGGAISSNAAIMRPSPPIWNETDQSLNFKVASSHLDEKGEIASGYYQLTIEENTAKCLWGDQVLNAKASVSVISSDGENKIFTSVLGRKDGFLHFAVSGFTYSTNIISIKFNPPSVPEKVQNQPRVIPKKKSITCTKGKVLRKFYGTNPKCPSGYKKSA